MTTSFEDENVSVWGPSWYSFDNDRDSNLMAPAQDLFSVGYRAFVGVYGAHMDTLSRQCPGLISKYFSLSVSDVPDV